MRWLFCFLWVGFVVTSAAAERPPARTRAEVDAVIGSKPPKAFALKPLRVCLVASKQDHGPGEHDYPAWQTNWTKLLGKAPRLTVSTAWQWPETFTNLDVVVFYFWNHDWSAERYEQLDNFLERGGGIVALHSATIADREPERLAERIGLAFQPGKSKYRHGPLDLKIVADANDSYGGSIVRGLPRTIHFVDESYWPMFGDTNSVLVLATTVEEGKDWPMIWTTQRGKGRIFGSVIGHYAWTYEDPLFRVIILRALAWVAREPERRFEALATEGVVLR